MEDIEIIIRSTCQELYDNLRHNNSFFSEIKSRNYLRKLINLNKKNDYKYIEIIRDEIGLLYKNYMVFCKKQEYDNNITIMRKIHDLYTDLCDKIEKFKVGNEIILTNDEYKRIERYVSELELTYGGQTEKYLKKLCLKNLGSQKGKIKEIVKDKSIIISEKKKLVKSILESKLNAWNGNYKSEKEMEIIYDSEKAQYIILSINNGNIIAKKRLKIKTNFSDIELLQKNAIKNLRQLNFNIDIYGELGISEDQTKYVDPFVLMILCKENKLDYAKTYLRLASGSITVKKEQLPFKITYKINKNFKMGKMTPVRNEIIAMIAERSDLTVAYLKYYSGLKIVKKINQKSFAS
ncbi:MAG: hypothetical protein IKE01_02245 [Clostridia bacterium]|nr:hypothetical protein [Clostridia bacterium]